MHPDSGSIRHAVLLSLGDDRIKILYGANLAMAPDLAMRCMTDQIPAMDTADTFADKPVEIGKTHIGKYKFEPVKIPEETDEGIETMIKAVIFDMDGVLIDSEIVYLNHMYEKLKFLYPRIKREALFSVIGSDTKRTMKIISDVIGEDTDSDSFKKLYKGLWVDCRPDYPAILRKEVPALLKELHRCGYLLALASSASKIGIDEVLTSCGLKCDFNYVVSGEEFKESKPNPEIYRHTAEVLKCRPQECLVVEDSTYGIMAGHSAGMTVAALIDDRFGLDQSLADYSMHSLSEVLSVLKSPSLQKSSLHEYPSCAEIH